MNSPACVRCGQPITPGARFCTRCGSDVSGEQGNVATARMPSVPAEEQGIEILRRATLGEYDVLAELGRGGMATVYLAHEISLDRKVAIKVMAPQLMFGEGMAERFRREARTAASLSHPHIIPIYAVKESGRVLYFVMKFVAGRPLDDIIRQVGALPIPMARAILSQVGGALGYAHRRGIIHRDIKPANIMIDDEGWAVVTDFGIAKVAETQGLTMTGVAVGTPSYMSPEQCAAKEVTGRSDQYSLGIVAYEMITGKQPFVADTAMAIMWQHFNDPPRPIRELRPECPPELEAAVLRMIEKQPDKRWGSIEDAMGAIGGGQLAHDDPIHIQMVGLAKSSLNQRLLDEMKTPTSLVPPTRASGKAPTEVMVTVGSVAVSPRSANLAAGDTLQLSVMVQDTRGETVAGKEVSWISGNPKLATVSVSGLVTALAPGEVVVTGTVEGHAGTCQLLIAPVPVVAVVVAPGGGSLEAGATLQLSATLRDPQGKPVTGRSIAWSSSNPAVATVSAQGLVAGSAPGAVQITASCEGKSGVASLTVVNAPVVVVELNPASVALSPGKSEQLTALLKDSRGHALSGRSVSWRSSQPSVATVTPNGSVSAVGIGSAEITASAEGKSAVARVTVTPIPVAKVQIVAPSRPLEVGEAQQLSVTIQDGSGASLDRPAGWQSSDPAVLPISAGGEITALRVGTSEITVTVEGKTARATVKVVPVPVATVVLSPPSGAITAGETLQLTAQARDVRGKPLPDRSITWTSSKPAVATVSSAGLVVGLSAGNAIIAAVAEGKKITAEVRVAAKPVPVPVAPAPVAPVPVAEAATQKMEQVTVEAATPAAEPVGAKKSRLPVVVGVIAVALIGFLVWRFGLGSRQATASGTPVSVQPSPAAPTLPVGDSIRMQLLYRDSANQEVTDSRLVTWASDNPAVAVVAGDWIRAVGGGSATIIADAGGLRGTATLTVSGAQVSDRIAVASLEVQRPPTSLESGETAQLAVETKDAQGAVLAGRPVVWLSSNPAVAQVSPVGLLTAGGEGTATITASSEGKSTTFSITISPVAVASVAVTPSRSSIEVSGTVQLAGQARDARGNALSNRPIQWSSSNAGVAAVSDNGTVTGAAVGTATITASVDGKTGTASVTVAVTRIDVATVSISPSGGEIEVGERLQLSAQLKDARGTVIRDRTPSWLSSDPSVATVSPSGQVLAVSPGTTTITASSDDKRATVRVVVARIAAASVAMTSPPANLPVGESFQLAASVRDERGAALTDRSVTWSSSNTQVATVSSTGMITAVGPGTARITATSEGRSVNVSLTVPRPPATVASVQLTPTALALESGATAQLTATPQDARGSSLERPVVWSTANATVATVSRNGLVTAGGPGSTTITATSDGKTSSANVTVAAARGPDVILPPPNTGGGAIARTAIAAGGNHTCGLLSGGVVACWGGGNGTPSILAGGVRFNRLSSGLTHTCGLTSGGEAWCWGQNGKGQVGDGTTNNTRAAPVAVAGGNSFRIVRAGGRHTCGLAGSGRVLCWGDNGSGQLGDGSTSGRTRPTPVPDLTFTDVAAGGSHSCGIATGGKNYCWGDGFSGQLGYGNMSTESSPTEVETGPVRFARIYAGGNHSCALTAAGKAYCWGDNRNAQVGDGSGSDRMTPVEVATGLSFEELTLGTSHTCGRTGAGSIYCWGGNGKGQVGDGTRGNRARPVKVAVEGSFISISAGATHTCAATATQAFCWGENARGQLGDGSLAARPTPAPIIGAGN
jgi:trimeric autotransporter adhesin